MQKKKTGNNNAIPHHHCFSYSRTDRQPVCECVVSELMEEEEKLQPASASTADAPRASVSVHNANVNSAAVARSPLVSLFFDLTAIFQVNLG